MSIQWRFIIYSNFFFLIAPIIPIMQRPVCCASRGDVRLALPRLNPPCPLSPVCRAHSAQCAEIPEVLPFSLSLSPVMCVCPSPGRFLFSYSLASLFSRTACPLLPYSARWWWLSANKRQPKQRGNLLHPNPRRDCPCCGVGWMPCTSGTASSRKTTATCAAKTLRYSPTLYTWVCRR